ncbi:enoyl-CoA hydratase-related protein [Streptomyces sp. NPDC005438]|uniref:enoyl-CoA hydratase-related protein n=1 Tax=Streptomyces sp. NPDC005438 TaxID=3156880 RepID=UPI0033AE85C1
MPVLDRHGPVYVLRLGEGENRFHPDWLATVNALLDEVEAAEGPRALVTAASGKFFSNGLDLDWVLAHPERREEYVASVQALFARFLTLPMVSVAALQGHAFAAGAMLSLAHDLRVMRGDRGYWCLPEATLGIPFTPGMSALIRSRLAPRVAHEAMVTARRYGGHQALADGIVDRTAEEGAVLEVAVEVATSLVDRAGPTVGAIRSGMYGPVLEALRAGEGSPR